MMHNTKDNAYLRALDQYITKKKKISFLLALGIPTIFFNSYAIVLHYSLTLANFSHRFRSCETAASINESCVTTCIAGRNRLSPRAYEYTFWWIFLEFYPEHFHQILFLIDYTMMITAIRSLAGRLNRARTGNNKAGPAEVIRNLNEIYCLIENYESAHLDADSLSTMRINCEDLILASDGSYVNSGHPVFFQPLPLARLPPPHPNDTLTQRELAVWTRCFDGVSLYERTPRDSAEFLSAVMQWHFTAFRRDVPGTKRLRPSLMEMTRWFPVYVRDHSS